MEGHSMVIQKTLPVDNDTIKKIKIAINKRKYAHADEISLLWQHALKSSSVFSWGKVMLISIISGLVVTIATYL
ncbi:3-oxoacyl-ACP synthase [Providencia huaxiensis]|uniref:3-oxoacyl-ACP synthase n=2 Tax=Morganellaceae TaxID=1903414 RepID=UPI001B3922D6|nr:3-oxoacyl-ACP synthase [Providencia huaxiensis]MBQ0534072.1 3-oxoacyl-ACP synthase [Providencia huaxiensis]MBQ0588771.1 3-oxoacyl-ACP synthase [Providencia huaxiensis]